MIRDCVSLHHVEHMAAECFHFDFATHVNQIQHTVSFLLFFWLLEMLFGYFIEQTKQSPLPSSLLCSGCNSDSRRTNTHGWHTTKYDRNIRFYYGFGYCYSKSVNRNEKHHTHTNTPVGIGVPNAQYKRNIREREKKKKKKKQQPERFMTKRNAKMMITFTRLCVMGVMPNVNTITSMKNANLFIVMNTMRAVTILSLCYACTIRTERILINIMMAISDFGRFFLLLFLFLLFFLVHSSSFNVILSQSQAKYIHEFVYEYC